MTGSERLSELNLPEEAPRVAPVTCISRLQGRCALRPWFSPCINTVGESGSTHSVETNNESMHFD